MGRRDVYIVGWSGDFLQILDSPSRALTDLYCLATPLLPLLQKIRKKVMEIQKVTKGTRWVGC